MVRFIEALAPEGVLPPEFGMWQRIREAEEGCDWIDPDPSMQMTFAVASDEQKEHARQGLQSTIQEVCDVLGLIRDNPQVDPGQPIPPAPNGQKYYGDWYNGIKTAVIAANSARPK
ncbi:MAG: hypothetical protein UR81_C0007G0013 [Candidatus Levybacteria bacterium GW2011_GWB1_35_5]|nr:MAG: hypothetical protein UR81_C0007G0013 [Candidatus Levybacteria bacterium GW2011_GWB1_35_5]